MSETKVTKEQDHATDKAKSNDMVKHIIAALEEKKAQEISVLDIEQVSVIADFFVIASGTNINQIQTLADYVEEYLERKGFKLKQKEGYASGNWVLLDFGDVIVHIFDQENRLLYDLEQIWKAGTKVL
jgi:ribosome-associated protein